MQTSGDVVVVRGERELSVRTAHLFTDATQVACAANDLYTWVAARPRGKTTDIICDHAKGKRIRKLFRPGVLLEPNTAEQVRELQRGGAEIRIATNELNETIIIDNRIALLAGDRVDGQRLFSVITRSELIQGISSLFEAAWRTSTALAVYDAQVDEIRLLAPRILDLLTSGCKDETAARILGLGLRTYRRRVAELMTALGATSRFQAGVRVHELGLS